MCILKSCWVKIEPFINSEATKLVSYYCHKSSVARISNPLVGSLYLLHTIMNVPCLSGSRMHIMMQNPYIKKILCYCSIITLISNIAAIRNISNHSSYSSTIDLFKKHIWTVHLYFWLFYSIMSYIAYYHLLN